MSLRPKITVLMPVYNGELYLQDSIESILGQTFRNFEFLIINDGSTDRSHEIISSYKDSRIRLLDNRSNLKLIATLNKGLDMARGEYVARMDCDDVSLPQRLDKQVHYMEAHSDIGICGTWVETFGGGQRSYLRHPTNPKDIKASLFFDSFLAHPTVMMRLSALNSNNLRYDPQDLHAEDYGLWVKSSFCFPLANIPAVLLKYRISSASIGQLHGEKQRETVLAIHRRNLDRLGIRVDERNLFIHKMAFFPPGKIEDRQLISDINEWFGALSQANRGLDVYPEPNFSMVLARKWFAVCYAAAGLGIWTWQMFADSPLASWLDVSVKDKIRFFLKCSINSLQGVKS